MRINLRILGTNKLLAKLENKLLQCYLILRLIIIADRIY